MEIKTIKKQKEFDYIYKKGKYFANKQIVIHYINSKYEDNLIGISISKKVGNAVTRNYLRRIIKEILRKTQVKTNMNFIIVVRKDNQDINYHEMEKSINHVLRKTGLLKKRNDGYE